MIGFQLAQEQRLKLSITPELKQSIHILTLSGYDLRQYLREQSAENPVLELEEAEEPWACRRKKARIDHLPVDLDPFWNVKAPEETLEERLLAELRLLDLPPDVYRAAAYYAGNLTDDGYLASGPAEAGEALGLGAGVAEAALKELQSLDPPGVGARDLRECLLLQIGRDPERAPYAKEIVQDHLQQLAGGKLEKIMAALRIGRQQAAEAVRYIRGLDPRPCLSYDGETPPYLVPDAVIEKRGGGWDARLHAAGVPKVTLNPDYREYAKKAGADAVSAYINGCVKSAEWIVRSTDMRKQTMLKVIRAVFEEQQPFLAGGAKALRPLTLADIAARLAMHESTVSRAVNDKYVLTPHGVFPLKYFFSTGIATADGGSASAKTVKLRLKAIIDAEDKGRPYSDQQLVEALAAEGMSISRRTVAKYRDELHILPSSARRSIV